MNREELLRTRVGKVMVKDVITVRENDVMSKVEELMISNRINHVPIVGEQYDLKGILTKNDVQLLKDWGTNLNLRTSIKANEQILNSNTADERMNAEVITVSEDDTLERCAEIFRNNVFHAIPVVSGSKLVGIITTYDMLKIAYGAATSIPSHNRLL